MSGGAGDAPRLETERLVVTLAHAGFAPALANFFRDNWHGHLDLWSPPAGPQLFETDFWARRGEAAVAEWQAGTAARFVLARRGDEGELVGTCNYTNIVRGPFQACYLGYQAARAHEGRGYMAEALRALNAFVFMELRLHRIMANYIPENARSERLLERLGFVREGLAKDYLFIAGAWRDHVLTSLSNAAYDASALRNPGR